MKLFQELAGQGRAVVMVLHDIGWASRFCDHVLMLFDNGRTYCRDRAQVLNRTNLEALYHCNMDEIAVGHARHFVPACAMPSV